MPLSRLQCVILVGFISLGVEFAVFPVALGNDECPSLYDDDNADYSTAVLAGDSGFNDNHTCVIDCFRDDEYDVVCEAVSFNDLIVTIQRMKFPVKRLNIILWSSPNIVELESGVFRTIRSQMYRLHLLNLTNLVNFPVLRESKIRSLKIEGAPQLTQFNAELLPKEIESIVLLATGINQLSADLQEVIPLENVKTFVFVRHSITSIGDNFLDIFPNLESLMFTENSVSITVNDMPDRLFTTKLLLKSFICTNNSFSGSTQYIQDNLMETIIENLNLANDSVVDLSQNNLPISKDAIFALSSINTTKTLSFSGNHFQQLFSAAGMFRGFDFLEDLNLSNTSLPKQKGLFRGLSKVKSLNLAENQFRELSRIDIFDELNVPLEKLDLSNNNLMALPKSQSARTLMSTVKELILSGNKFHSELLAVSSPDKYPSPFPLGMDFASVSTLDLSKTGLRIFKGSWISRFDSLIKLDISCNKFQQITDDFFREIPATLEILTMSFCAENKQVAPKFTDGAFASLGNDTSVRLNQLIMRSGYFKTWIFKVVSQMPEATKKSVKLLDLSQNQIKYLARKSLVGFPYLEKLHLGENFLQTVGQKAFSDLSSLQWLNLSSNHIVSVQVGEFDDLPHLTLLDLSSNGIISIGEASFDSLTAMTHLYLGGNNLQGYSYIGMFSEDSETAGKNLVHLSLARNPISLNTYPAGCIFRRDLNPLTSLKYLYIDQSTVVYVDYGTSNTSLSDQLRSARLMPNDPNSLACDYGPTWFNPDDPYSASWTSSSQPGGLTEWTDDFIRLLIEDPTDLTPRTFTALIPKCYSSSYKYVRNATTTFFCPLRDSRTYDPSAKQPDGS